MSVEEHELPVSNKKRIRLFDFIKRDGIVFEHVKLSSSVETDYYYDIKRVALSRDGIDLLGELLLQEMTAYAPRSVGGLEMGAIPLATAVMIKSTGVGEYKVGLDSFFIRKDPKTHGLEKKIEGKLTPPAVIVDDVITSGQSVMDAINAVNALSYNVKAVVCVIDREEDGTPNVLKENQIKYSSLFKHSEFKPFIEEQLKKKQKIQSS
jgi:orotate phosphoribosyltransferase